MLIDQHRNDTPEKGLKFDINLAPKEIAHFKIFTMKYEKTEGKEKAIKDIFNKIKVEEEMKEKAYVSGTEKDQG